MQAIGFILLFVIIVTFFVATALRSCESINSNFEIMAQLLHANVQKPYWNLPFFVEVKGNYLGRRISCRYFCFLHKPEPELYIEPLAKAKKRFLSDPSENTYFVNGKIFYRYKQSSDQPDLEENKLLSSIANRKLSELEMIKFFEELTLAAMVIEARPNY